MKKQDEVPYWGCFGNTEEGTLLVEAKEGFLEEVMCHLKPRSQDNQE